jgi:hypothetical protein
MKLSRGWVVLFVFIPLSALGQTRPPPGSSTTGWSKTCPVLTFEVCRETRIWGTTPCALQQRSACQTLLTRAFEAAADKIQREELVIVPQGLPGAGTVVSAKFTAASLAGMLLNQPSSYLGRVLGAQHDALLAPDALAVQRQAWEDNGARVESCEEYVYERWYDYSVFEDHAFSFGTDYRAIYDFAYAPRGGVILDPGDGVGTCLTCERPPIHVLAFELPHVLPDETPWLAYRTLEKRNGTPMESQIPWFGHVPKNTFFVVPPDTFRYPQSLPPDLVAALEAGRELYAPSWDWHNEMNQSIQAASITDEQLYELEARKAEYEALVTRRWEMIDLMGAISSGINSCIENLTNPILVMGGVEQHLGLPDPAPIINPVGLVGNMHANIATYAGANMTPKLASALSALSVRSAAPRTLSLINDASSTSSTGEPAVPSGMNCNFNALFAALGDTGEQLKGVETEMAALLVAEWNLPNRGCLTIDGPPACDWSPRMFAKSVMGRFSNERERDYRRCQDMTKGGFYLASDPAAQAAMNFPETRDFTISTDDLEQFFLYMAQAAHSIPTFEDAEVTGSTEEKTVIGERTSDSGYLGDPDLFSAGYAYDVWYGLHSFAYDPENPDPKKRRICSTTTEAHAKFAIPISIFGCSENLLEAEGDVKAGVSGFSGKVDLKVLGFTMEPSWKYEGTAQFDIVKAPKMELADKAKYSHVFPVGPISVTVSAGVSGALGLDVRLGVGISEGCDIDYAMRLYANATPTAKITGEASAGVGVPGFSIGIYGKLTLIEAGLPFENWIALGADEKDGATSLLLNLHSKLSFSIKALDGELGIYVQFIKKWKRAIVDWDGLKWSTDIFKYDVRIPILAAVDATDPASP